MVMLVAREISPTTSSFLTWLAPRRHVCGFVRRALCVWPSTDIPTGRREEPKKQEVGGGGGWGWSDHFVVAAAPAVAARDWLV